MSRPSPHPLRYVFTDTRGIEPYIEGLRAIEQAIRYPLGDDGEEFVIDHGERYHPFFTGLGEPYFSIALDGDSVAGTGLGILRQIERCGLRIPAYYIADLKIAPPYRGQGVAQRIIMNGITHVLRDPRLRRFQFAYAAAMRGERGDVMRSARGLHPMRLLHAGTTLALYFVPPARLSRLRVEGAPPPPRGPGVDFSFGAASADNPLGIVSTAGKKDLRIVRTGDPWPLAHLTLGPSAWRPTWGAMLARAGEALVERGEVAQTCFAIDERLADHIAWLSTQGIRPSTVCTVYAMNLVPSLISPGWVHLATSEI